MPKTVNMREDEALAFQVQRYPCIYNKEDPGHKEKDRVINAWKEIDNALDLTEGEAKRRFENLKKRFSKKKRAMKKASRSGTGNQEATAAANNLREYEFLSWLSPFLKLKPTVDNLPSVNDISNMYDSSATEDGASSDQSVVMSPPVKKARLKNKAKPTTDLEVMEKISKALDVPPEPKRQQDGDDIFGLMVAVELKSLSERRKRRLKHDINNLIFKYQEEEEDDKKEAPAINPWQPLPTTAETSINGTWPFAGLNVTS